MAPAPFSHASAVEAVIAQFSGIVRVEDDIARIACGTSVFPDAVAIVDIADLPTVMDPAYRWAAHRSGLPFVPYVMRCAGPGRPRVRLHRLLMGVTDRRIIVDHRDRDTLNNRRQNLRVTITRMNAKNRIGYRSSALPKGVSFLPGRGRYWARIGLDRKMVSLGTYATAEEAALAYDAAAIRLHGEFALTNAEIARRSALNPPQPEGATCNG